MVQNVAENHVKEAFILRIILYYVSIAGVGDGGDGVINPPRFIDPPRIHVVTVRLAQHSVIHKKKLQLISLECALALYQLKPKRFFF